MVESGARTSSAPSQQPIVGMILAAGLGTRLAPYTDRVPKPLVPFFDVPLITYAVVRLAAAGISRLVVNTYHRCEPLEAYLEALVSGMSPSLELHVSREDVLLGTGGGIALASRFFDQSPVLVVNSDLYFDFDLSRLVQHHRATSAVATALLHEGSGFDHLRSTLVDDAGWVTHIGPAVPDDRSRRVFAGAYVLEPAAWERLSAEPSSVIGRAFHPLLAEKAPVAGLVEAFRWCDLGTWQAYWSACRQVLREPDARGPFGLVRQLSPGRFVGAEAAGSTGTGPCYLGPEVAWPGDEEVCHWAVLQRGVEGGDGDLSGVVALPGTRLPGRCAAGVYGPGFTIEMSQA